MKNMGGKVVVALALVVGLATAYVVHQYVNGVRQEAKPIPMAQVVTAAREIPARTMVTTDMLRVAQVPVTVKLPQAIVDPSQAAGKVSKEPISTGEQVLTTKLFGDRVESGLAFVVPPNKRAVAVAVNEVVGSGGLIEPGDSVDVVAVVDLKAASANEQGAPASPQPSATPPPPRAEAAAQYILQNVEVLAVAQTLEGDTPAANNSGNPLVPARSQPPQPAAQLPSAQPQAHTVTLAVAPDEAARLILAEEKGHIRLVLRAHGDNSNIKMPDDPLFTSLPGQAIERSNLRITQS
jgi:pilus assembly protein CpaB